ncbi:MAG: hypothetical protein R6U55_14785 [Desulfovermiculus sp.]
MENMVPLTHVLLAVVIVLLLIILSLVLKRRQMESEDIESAVSSAWYKSGIDEKIGRLTIYAQDIRNEYRVLDQMLRVPIERASLGEIALEQILSDQLPPDMFGVRNDIARLSQRFGEIDRCWRIFYDSHLRNAAKKAEEVDEAYRRVREEFDRISKVPGD